jgi:hypothetical protein
MSVTTPRYEDLIFEPHPLLGATAEWIKISARLRRALPDLPDEILDRRVEWAEVTFPNGWSLSILRNMLGLHPFCDFETCRLHDGVRVADSITAHVGVDEVQREIDEVASL